MMAAALAVLLVAVSGAQAVDQSQNFKIDVYADNTNQWTGERNTLWNSWGSHPSHGHSFLSDPRQWMSRRWKPREIKNVRIMGGMKDPTKHRWLLSVKDGEPVCDFTGLIEILKAELAHNLTPGIVLDKVPWELAYRTGSGPPLPDSVKYWGKYGHAGPPTDYDVWKKYVKAFLRACIEAFGYEEVSSWQYRVATEPDNDDHWNAGWNNYIKHYDHTVQAVTEIIPNAWIGPGNFIAIWLADEQHENNYKVEDFLKHCARGVNYATGEKGTRMTFLAFSAYVMSASPQPDKKSFCHDIAFRKAKELLDKYPQLNKYMDNDAMPGWFTIEVHEYGDPHSLNGGEWLWMTEWMAGFHAYVMDLAYNSYGVYTTCFWFQSQWYDQMYPYVRVNQMLDEMQGGRLVEVKKKTASQSDKVKYGAISAWKDGSLYVLIYNFNWDPLHQGTLHGERTHTIDNTITLAISGKSISAHRRWSLDHKIINEKSGNGSWYYAVKADLDTHPDLEAQDGNYYVRSPEDGWKGPVEDVLFSKWAYADNGLYEKYKKLSEIGIVATDIPVRLSGKEIVYTSENFTQSGVQFLKFTPVQEKREKR